MKLIKNYSRLMAATGFLCGLWCFAASAGPDDCAVCGKPIEKKLCFWQDEVAGEKKKVCEPCSELTPCYLCGVPVKDIGRELSDGRILCARDWMLHGTDDLLVEGQLERIRDVQPEPLAAAPPSEVESSAPPAQTRTVPSVPTLPAAPDALLLQGIVWSPSSATAVINGRTFGSNDVRKVRLGGTNVTVRCLEIRPDAVVIQVNGGSERRTLTLEESW